ncbi:hypothetical protein [Segatella bryantii]|uniref:hypothetical protein n=1 Tax=Segatella bryantii TaxID=77095 RepID=UPI00242B2589|nr:hypothetical protein [Segatella bryantii]
MKKGDIARKWSTEFHIQTGPYMRIEHIEENRLYCGVLNSDTPNVMLLNKNRAITISHQCLQIPDKKLRELVEKQAKGTEFQTLTHPLTKTWIKAYKDTPKIIKLYSNKGNEFYFKLLSVGITRNLRENVVKIILQKL